MYLVMTSWNWIRREGNGATNPWFPWASTSQTVTAQWGLQNQTAVRPVMAAPGTSRNTLSPLWAPTVSHWYARNIDQNLLKYHVSCATAHWFTCLNLWLLNIVSYVYFVVFTDGGIQCSLDLILYCGVFVGFDSFVLLAIKQNYIYYFSNFVKILWNKYFTSLSAVRTKLRSGYCFDF